MLCCSAGEKSFAAASRAICKQKRCWRQIQDCELDVVVAAVNAQMDNGSTRAIARASSGGKGHAPFPAAGRPKICRAAHGTHASAFQLTARTVLSTAVNTLQCKHLGRFQESVQYIAVVMAPIYPSLRLLLVTAVPLPSMRRADPSTSTKAKALPSSGAVTTAI